MKHAKKQVIPVHRMDAQNPSGIGFGYMEVDNEYDEIMVNSSKNMIHRDDYYLFLFLKCADALLTIDFEEVQLTGNTVLYIRPGQVHFMSSMREAKGWSLSIDPMLVEKDYRNMFEEQFLTQKSVALETSVSIRMSDIAQILYATIQAEQTVFSNRIILDLANVFIGAIAEQYAGRQENLRHHKSRSVQIAHQFKELLSTNFKTLKSPTLYAKMLNYSLSHLNESVKHITGFPVSYWIHQQVVLEARRLLYYTDMDVKEIAFSLGYEDHTYFSHLFAKFVGQSPGTFRRKFHR